MIVVGIDENGYGPKLGPLIATAVAVEVPNLSAARLSGEEKTIKDSKKVFRRTPSSYAIGESTALAILEEAGRRPTSLRELIDSFALLRFEAVVAQAGESAGEMWSGPFGRLTLPVWSEDTHAPWEAEISDANIRGVAIAILFPRSFNSFVSTKGTKTDCDFQLFFDLAVYGPPGDAYVLGKIGGVRYYTPLLSRYRLDRLAILPEWTPRAQEPDASAYCFEDGREMHFVKDADSQFIPVALASIVGKYVRDLFMLVENRHFGFDELVPAASGYPSDPLTAELIARIQARCAPESLGDWVRIR